MRFARKLFVLAVMALAAMALGASSASAQVTVTDEHSTLHCDDVTLDPGHIVEGGCRVNAESEVETQVQAFVAGVGFVTISTCEDHFEAAIGEDGTGYLYESITEGHAGPPCTRTQCDEANGTKRPWPLAVETALTMEITFCLRNVSDPAGSAGTTCHTNVDLTDDGTHDYEFRATGAAGSGSCENLGGGARVIGHWLVTPDEAHDEIEID